MEETQKDFPLLDSFAIPEGGVCGAFVSEAAMELMQTDDPKRQVGQENMEQQELTVETTDELSPSHAERAKTAVAHQPGDLVSIMTPKGRADVVIDEVGEEGMYGCHFRSNPGVTMLVHEDEIIEGDNNQSVAGFADTTYKDEQYGGQGLPKYVKDTKTGKVFGVIVHNEVDPDGDVSLTEEPDGPPWLFCSVQEMKNYIAKGDFEPQEPSQRMRTLGEYGPANPPWWGEANGPAEGLPEKLTSGGGRMYNVVKQTDGNVAVYEEGETTFPSIVATVEQLQQMIQDGAYKAANAGGGLESNDVVAPEGLPTKAEDEQGGQDMQNRENVLSMKQFPDFNDLPENERFAMRLAVMMDSEIAETPTDVLLDALDTIDNRRSGAEPTLEQKGYKTKILEELKNRGVDKKATYEDYFAAPSSYHGTVDEAYEKFMEIGLTQGIDPSMIGPKQQEDFDVVSREVGLGGREIEELAQRLRNEGFQVEAGRRPFRECSGKVVRKCASEEEFNRLYESLGNKPQQVAFKYEWTIDYVIWFALGMVEAAGVDELAAGLRSAVPETDESAEYVNEGRRTAQGLSPEGAVLFAFLTMEDANAHSEGAPLWDWVRQRFGLSKEGTMRGGSPDTAAHIGRLFGKF